MARHTARSRRGEVHKQVALSVLLSGEEPPSEFQLFTAGTVETTKGTFVFDEACVASVMSEYRAHGIDLMIDYDHASLAGVSLDPATAGKAAGWFNLEVRNGELWAVNVRWTESAAKALRAKEWRFMSPAFQTEGNRIVSVMNVALTNLPATRQLSPLVAASSVALGEHMDSTMISEALDALIAGDSEKCAELLKGLIAAAAGEEAAETPAEESAEVAEMAESPLPAADDEKDKPAEVAAATSKLMRLSGKASIVEALSDVETWLSSHVTLETERQKLAAERAVLEAAERRKLCVELVTLGGRAPSTVWADDKATAPKSYLQSMPIAELRAMHADAVKAGGRRAPTKAPTETIELSAREVAKCKAAGVDPAKYIALKNQMNGKA